MTRRLAVRGALLAVALGAVAAATPAPRPGPRPTPAPRARVETAAVVRIAGTDYVSVGDLARLTGGVRRWRADLRRLELGVSDASFTFVVDNPYVVAGDRTWRLEAPVRSLGGDVLAPLGVLALLPADSLVAPLVWDSAGARVRRGVPPRSAPRWETEGDGEWLTWDTDAGASAQVLSRVRRNFRLRVPGGSAAGLDSFPAGALMRRVRASRDLGDAVVELSLSPEAESFRLESDPGGRVRLRLARRAGPGDERFGAEANAGPRVLSTIVLDPAHGGADGGARAGGRVEKDIVLEIARELRGEIERRAIARVVLTREADEGVTRERRAETANRAHPDLVLSLHVDGWPTPRARGATVWCMPATPAPDEAGGRARWLPWRTAAGTHAADARALADAIVRTFEARGLGPVRVVERPHASLMGVASAALVVECATWTSPADRTRLGSTEGVRETARALTDAIAEWQRHE